MEKDALTYIKESRSQAEKDALAMRAALVRQDRAAFSSLLREYLCIRFDLERTNGEQSIEKLARMSLIKSKGTKAVAESDRGINCANASTAEDKSLLFVLVCQRALGVTLTPAQTASINTMPQLEEAIWSAYAA